MNDISTTRWTVEQLNHLKLIPSCVAPLIGEADVERISEDVCVWDAWPILQRDGSPAPADLWMALASPWFADPDERHGHARIHLFERRGEDWRHYGPVMPDGFSPGSREWSGSAYVESDGRRLTLYFTAAGFRGESELSFEQRLFEVEADLVSQDGGWSVENCRNLLESFPRDPRFYADPLSAGGGLGTIKAFRDPGYLLDPASGEHWLLFTGSLATSQSAYNGVIGAARAKPDALGQWEVTAPIISADGLNNELERPHIVLANGLYYLFWSTQTHVFNPEAPRAPTGLYGMVSGQITHGWKPLNGSGLVIANPPEAPRQAYSWLVLPDLSVTAFADDWGRGEAAEGAKRFAGTFAPFLRLALDGETTRIID
ncbi:levansucrase [Sphingobium sp. B1D7B]|uniref:glycoside hydrolase family 68 protein n=1 Tax=unclassified Sphingobium TaxID=2611147 RepID=UPI002225162B|nr:MULTISPECIES: glycoside hydrolase family 68 protein [unclassified Sphingobium]MCW2390336.1 levansucrase [Sphingobium sp. B11D3A]MCW2405477.1 levansucrase [Sphingobium sp. B1D7B]